MIASLAPRHALASEAFPAAPGPDLREAVEQAAASIAPQWPLATFAARNPWQGFEGETFDAVARWFTAFNASSLYPDAAHLRELDETPADSPVLQRLVHAWLREHGHDPEPRALRYCLAALKDRSVPADATLKQREAGDAEALHLLETTSIRWLKLFAARDESAWPLAGDSLYAAWRDQARFDTFLPSAVRKALRTLPDAADDALYAALRTLTTPEEAVGTLRAHLLALPGWAGMLRWRGRRQGDELALLTEYLALRLTLEVALTEGAAPLRAQPENPVRATVSLLADWERYGGLQAADWEALDVEEARHLLRLAAEFDDAARARLGLELREELYKSALQKRLPARPEALDFAPEAQLVFCIDVRSEPVRRAVEASGPFVTFGYAGFFGLPIRTRELESEHTHDACPVILAPQAEVGEKAEPRAQQRFRVARRNARQRIAARLRLKQDPLASLALPEFEGPWQGAGLLWHSFVPARWRQRWSGTVAPAKPRSVPTVGRHGDDDPQHRAREAQWAAGALKGIGLTRDFAPLVVIAGHGGRSRNNPYAAKLLCGACGGAAGGFNARVLASLCNDPSVRGALRAQGIDIPDTTVFVAAEHQTSLDALVWLDERPHEGVAARAWDSLNAALPRAFERVRRERLSRLPDLPGLAPRDEDEALRRADDWSETRPEWGLAGNAAILIGPREWTRGIDLEGRAFLHGYRWDEDPEGTLLAGIIAGPVTVAQWINLQYYASSVAPHYQGSGSKTTQTVTAGVGVMQGNGSDLLAGLPWQAVMENDAKPYHAPQRLLVAIEAPPAHIERLLATQPAFADKVRNRWLLLASFDRESGRWTDW